MRLLLDTHIVVWWIFAPQDLSKTALAAIADPSSEIFVSAITAMEIATKVRLGKFEQARPLSRDFTRQILDEGFNLLPITADHGERAGNMILAHKDPWDRLLIAQAQIEGFSMVTNDHAIAASAISTVW